MLMVAGVRYEVEKTISGFLLDFDFDDASILKSTVTDEQIPAYDRLVLGMPDL